MNDADPTARLLGEAIAALDRAAEQPSEGLSEAAAAALRGVVRLRDTLLEMRRIEISPEPRVLGILEAANAALSLISGVAYPAGKLDRTGLQQARAALAVIVDAEHA
jgi:hypothetical protein